MTTRALAVGERLHHLKVFFSNRYVYAQVLRKTDGHILVSASTVEKGIKEELVNRSDKAAAAHVGRTLAERAKAASIPAVHFVKPKNKPFHGKLRVLIESVRDAGMKFNYGTMVAVAQQAR